MPPHHATTYADRDKFVQLHRAGQSYRQIAAQTGWSWATVRDHCRAVGDNQPARRLGRPRGLLGSFDPRVRFAALRLKRRRPGWGPIVILDELSQQPHLRGCRLPRPSQLAAYYRQFGSRLVRPQYHRRLPPPVVPLPAYPERIVFQLDAQERLSLPRLGRFNLLDIRAPGWGVLVGCYPHPAPRGERISLAQSRDDCRLTFEAWGLPEVLQSDHDKLLVNTGDYPFPSWFTLWLVGLGIHHQLIQRVTQNGCVERSHRTSDKQMLLGMDPADWPTFLAHVVHEQVRLNERIPSRAKACHGQPPLVAHPEALTPRRPYTRAGEAALFEMSRVHAYLAAGRWVRLSSDRGQFTLADRVWTVGSAYAHQVLVIQFDLAQGLFNITTTSGTWLKALPSDWLTPELLRGLPESPSS